MSDQSTEAKQRYLRDNIIEQGYDPEAFMIYCDETQGNINLQSWPMQKLAHIVSSFISFKLENTFTQQQLDNDNDWTDFHYPQGQQQIQQTKSNSIVLEKQTQVKQDLIFSDADWGIFGTDTSVRPNIQTNSSPQLPKKPLPLNQKIQIKKDIKIEQKYQTHKISEITQMPMMPKQQIGNQLKISNENTSNKIIRNGTLKIKFSKIKDLDPLPPINDVEIIKIEKQTKNFLKGQQTIYHIKFNPCGHIIQKKFSDMRRLRTIMRKIYPHILIPYLQPQGWIVNSSEGKDPELLSRYKYQIIQFLKYILVTNEIFKKSKIVRIFCCLFDNKNDDFKKYETVPKPKKFSQLCLPGNQLVFDQFKSLAPIDKYMTNMQFLVTDIETHYEKLRKHLEVLFYNYDLVAKSLNDIALIFESLQNSICRFNMENDPSKDLRIYEGIKDVCLRMRSQISTHQDIFRNKYHTLFKYEKDNMSTFKQLNDIRAKMYTEYMKTSPYQQNNEDAKGQVIVDGQIGIDEVNRNNKNILRVQNMFWSHFTLEGVHRYWQELRNKINEKLTITAYEKLDNQNENLNFWNTVIKRCVI